MIHKDIFEIKNVLKPYMDKLVIKFNIRMFYIFGSYATGKNDKNSDIDIAVLLREPYDHMLKLYLLGELNTILKRDDIDLVILNSANTVLKHQVIKYGRAVYEENLNAKVEFEVKALDEYMDMEPFRRRQAEIVKMQISDMLRENSK